MDLNNIKSVVQGRLVTSEDIPHNEDSLYSSLVPISREVIASYQNANRWLDSIKEHLLINMSLPYLSEIVHQLAHIMPGEFDKFGDILHTENLLVYYPSTTEYVCTTNNIYDILLEIHNILRNIEDALIRFKKSSEELDLYYFSAECDTLLRTIKLQHDIYYRAEGWLTYFGDNLSDWECRVHQYYLNKLSEDDSL